MTAPDHIQLAKEGLELASKATPGPWNLSAETVRGIPLDDVVVGANGKWVCASGAMGNDIDADANAAFIAWVRNNFEAIARAVLDQEQKSDDLYVGAKTWIEELQRQLAEAQKRIAVLEQQA